MRQAESAAFEIPQAAADAFAKYIACEYAYLTPSGKPLCWPVTPYWDEHRHILSIATGLAYPNKADYAKVHEKVALLFSDPKGSGLSDGTTILVQGNATVLDGDMQWNLDRYVVELRKKFPAARLAINPLTVRFLDFYLPRLWVEVTPVRLTIWDRSGKESVYGAPAAPEPKHQLVGDAAQRRNPLSDRETQALRRVVRQAGTGVVTVIATDGFPHARRMEVIDNEDGTLELEYATSPGPASITFHEHTLGGTRFKAHMARGMIEERKGRHIFTPRRLVGFFGNGFVFPLSVIPEVTNLRRRLKSELNERGLSMPKLRVPRPEDLTNSY